MTEQLRVVHELPLIELCNGLVVGALKQGFERLEVLAPRPGAVIAEIRGRRGKRSSRFFDGESPSTSLCASGLARTGKRISS